VLDLVPWLLPFPLLAGCPGSIVLVGDAGDAPDAARPDDAGPGDDAEADTCDPDTGGFVSRADRWLATLGAGGCTEGEAWGVAAGASGGAIVVGSTRRPGGYAGSDIWIVRLDAHGNLVWQQRVGGDGTDIGEAVVELPDGTLVVAGGHEANPSAPGLQPWIGAFGPDGALRWQRTVWDAIGLTKLTAVAFADGTIAAAGRIPGAVGDESRTWFVGFDLAGEAVWQWTIGADDPWVWVEQIVPMPGGGFALAGYANGSGATHQDLWLARADGSGTLLWQRRWDGVGFDGLVGVTPYHDGLAAVGFTMNDAWTESWPLVMTFDAAGQLLDAVSLDADYRLLSEAIAAAPGGGLLFVGARPHGATAIENRMAIVQLDDDLGIAGDAEFEVLPWGRFHHAVVGESGSLYAAGRTGQFIDGTYRDSQIVVSRLPADLRSGVPCSLGRIPSLEHASATLVEVDPGLAVERFGVPVIEATMTVRPIDVPVRFVCGE
jgi:hypothetical protein